MGGPAGLRKWVGAARWRCPPQAEGLPWTPLGTLAGWVRFPSPREAWVSPAVSGGAPAWRWGCRCLHSGLRPVDRREGGLSILFCRRVSWPFGGVWSWGSGHWWGGGGVGLEAGGGMTFCVTHPLDLRCLCVHVAPLLWCDCPEGSPLPSPTIALLAGPLCSGRWHSPLPSHASLGVGQSGVASSAVEPQSVARHALVPSHRAAYRFSALEDGWVPGLPIPSCFCSPEQVPTW